MCMYILQYVSLGSVDLISHKYILFMPIAGHRHIFIYLLLFIVLETFIFIK